jgi:hypothetical protein
MEPVEPRMEMVFMDGISLEDEEESSKLKSPRF